MKKSKILDRLLAGILSALLIALSLPLSLFASAAETETAEAPPSTLDGLQDYVRQSESKVLEDCYGNKIDLHFYYDTAKTYTAGGPGKSGTPILLYIMNTGVERIGQDTDENIVRGMLERGYYVVVLDYSGVTLESPELDRSVQSFAIGIATAEIKTPGKASDTERISSIVYPIPAGYDIAYNIPYFSYDKHGAAGTLELIVEIWNNDFKSVKRDKIVKWVDEDGVPLLEKTEAITDAHAKWFADENKTDPITQEALAALSEEEQKQYPYTYVGNTKAETVTDCVKPDGSFIDLDLGMDIIYPTSTAEKAAPETPVMCAFSSSYTRACAWTSDNRPQLVGFLMSGYTGVISDYGLVPMARNDHYGYFSGTGRWGSTSGDNYTYSLTAYNGIKSDTALLRMLRKISVDGLTVETDGGNSTADLKLNLDIDAIGVYGNSKAGLCTRLANPNPEKLEEIRHFDGHVGETRYDAMNDPTYGYNDPYLDKSGETAATIDARIRLPEDTQFETYADGTPISSQANLVYAQCGGCWENITEGCAPFFATGTQKPGGDGCSYWLFYRYVMNMTREADVPFYGLVCPEVGHCFGYGEDKDYGIDTYYAFHRYANYWLHGADPTCEIIDVDAKNDIGIALDDDVDYIYEIEEGSAIRLQFIGQIGGEEIGKVEIVNALTGKALTGQWTSVFGGQQWKFLPTNIEENTYYRITVPTTIRDQKGRSLAEEKTLLFRTASGSAADAVTTETAENGDTYFVFAAGEYDTSYKTTLRFTVEDADAANTLTVSASPLSDGQSPSAVTDWKSLGEVVIIGADTYTFDVTEYMKDQTGRVVFRLSAKYEAGIVSTNELTFGETTDLSRLGFGMINYHTLASIDAPYEGADKTLCVNGFTRTSSWIDRNNDLSGNYVASPNLFLRVYTGISSDDLTAADLGRTFRISFRIYDTTSRQILAVMKQDARGDVYDFDNMRKTYTTKAGEWTTIEFDFTVDSLEACSAYDCRYLYLYAENKSAVHVDPYAAPVANEMALASNGAKPSGYAGERGLTDAYTVYGTALAAMKAGKVTINTEHSHEFYLDDLTFTEVRTSAAPISVKLVSHPLTEAALPTLGGVTLDSSDPTGTGSTTLTVSGGLRAEDTASKKVYMKLSLADYTAETPAYFSFTASGEANTLSVYGVKDAASGEGWDPATVTASTAPANDPRGGGVLLSEVYNGEAIVSASVKDGDTVTMDITDYATERKKAGYDTLTLIIVAAERGDVAVGTQDFTGLTDSDLKAITSTIGHKTGFTEQHIVTEDGNTYYTIKKAQSGDALHLSGIFGESEEETHKLWKEEDVGRTFRVTFRAKNSGADSTVTALKIGMMAGINRNAYNSGTSWTVDKNETADAVKYGWNLYLPSDQYTVSSEWKTYTYTFTVDETMLPKDCICTDGTKAKQAISYLGICPIASTYGENAVLCVDDVSVEEVYGATGITPIAPKTGYTVCGGLDFTAMTSLTAYCAQVGYSYNDTGTHSLVQNVTRANGESGTVFSFETKTSDATPHLTGLFDETAPTSYETHKLWTAADVGKTYRITFYAKAATNNVTSLQFGIMSRVSRNIAYGSTSGTYTLAQTETKAKDDQSYSFNFYSSASVSLAGGDWVLCTYTFTVDEQMLPREIIRRETGAAVGQQAISYLGIRPIVGSGEYSKGGTVYVDTVKVEQLAEVPGAAVGAQDFTGLSDSDLGAITSTIGHKVGSTEQHIVTEGGNTYYTIKTAQADNALHLSGIFGESAEETHKLWKEEDVGRTYRVTFRAKTSGTGNTVTALKIGMMAGINRNAYGSGSAWTVAEGVTADAVKYGWNLYQPSDQYTVSSEWKTYTYTFTVDETMLPKKCVNGSTTAMHAISYLGICPIASDYTKNNILCVDDIIVREVNDFAGSTLPVVGALTLGGGGTATDLEVSAHLSEREHIQYTLLPFKTEAAENIKQLTLSFDLAGTNAETAKLYLLAGKLPSSLTWETVSPYLNDPVATFTVKDGKNTVDVTEQLSSLLGQKVLFVLTVEEEGGVIGVSTPTLTIGSATAEDFDADGFKVRSNLTLASDLRYNLYIPKLDVVKEITLDGVAQKLYDLPTREENGVTYYVVTKAFAAKNAADTVTAEVFIDTGAKRMTATYAFSIPAYAKKIVDSESYGDTTKTLMKDMLAYIDAAMTYFGTATEEKRSTIASVLGTEYTPADLATFKWDNAAVSTDTASVLDTACLELGDTPAFVFYLKKGQESLADSFNFTMNGTPLKVEVKKEVGGKERTYLVVTTYAYGVNDTLTFNYAGGNGSYNLAAYHSGTDASNTDLKTLTVRLAKYANSAKAYKAAAEQN